MSYSMNIWCEVHGTDRTTQPKYGGKNGLSHKIMVGTGSGNSHDHGCLSTMRIEHDDGSTSFQTHFSGTLIHEQCFDKNWTLTWEWNIDEIIKERDELQDQRRHAIDEKNERSELAEKVAASLSADAILAARATMP